MEYVIVVLLAYLIGTFATSYFAGKILRGIDIREHGSGNLGATNTFRVLGFRAGLIVLIVDILKGFIAVLVAKIISQDILVHIFAGCSVVIGHNWPVFLKFKGGKGIASSLGVLIALFPLISGILFVVAAAIIAVTKYVSLASISAAILFPILLIIFREPVEGLIFGCVLSVFAIYRHRSNIERLINGNENKISFGRNK